MITIQKMKMTLKTRETSHDHNSYSSMYKESLLKDRKEPRKENNPNSTRKKKGIQRAWEDMRKKS